MKILYSLVLISAVISCTISGCDGLFNKCHPDFNFVVENSHTFELHDYHTGERLLGIEARYNRDTVKIFDEGGQIFFDGPVDLDGRIHFPLVNINDYGVINQPIIRELYLYLDYQDTDTLRYEFEMRNNNCGHQVYYYTKLTYNDSVYVDEYNYRFRSVTLYKK